MSMKCGFDADVEVNGTSIKTIGDITYDESKTEIEIKNRESKDIRYIQGMTATVFNLQIQAGIDPESENSVDGYSIVKTLYESEDAFVVTFTSPSGFTRTKNMICTNFKPSEPVDGLSVADAVFRVSGKSLPTTDVGT